MNNKWNKDIHNRLKDFPKKAPEGLLDDIKQEMARRGFTTVPVSNGHQSHYRPIIYRIAAVAAVFLLIFGFGYQWFNRPISPIQEARTITQPMQKEPTITDIQEAAVSPLAQISTTNTSKITTITPSRTIQMEEQPEATDTVSQPLPTEEEKPISPQPSIRKASTKVYPSNQLAYATRKKGASFSTGVYYSGVITPENRSFLHSANKGLLMSEPTADIIGENQADMLLPLEGPLKEEVRHRLPIKIGISVRYNIQERWSLQSGLIYSYLSSDFSQSNQRISYQTTQRLHYIGIPLQLGYQIAEGKRFKSYLSAGGQIERQINGKATTDYSVNNKHQSSSTQKVSNKRLLFSALASIGAEYMLGKGLSLYAEPGIHYYFKNGNGLQTYYNEQPLNFNITLGFRFHWKK